MSNESYGIQRTRGRHNEGSKKMEEGGGEERMRGKEKRRIRGEGKLGVDEKRKVAVYIRLGLYCTIQTVYQYYAVLVCVWGWGSSGAHLISFTIKLVNLFSSSELSTRQTVHLNFNPRLKNT